MSILFKYIYVGRLVVTSLIILHIEEGAKGIMQLGTCVSYVIGRW